MEMVERAAEQKETVLLYAPGQGLKITRVFTQAGKDPLETNYELRKSTIRNPDGSTVFELTDIEVPKEWSQVATDIVAQKYFRKAGVPQFNPDGTAMLDANGKQVTGSEKSAKQVVKRLAGCWRYWGEKYGYFASTEDAQAFEDEMLYMLIHQMASPNSPQWFNTGLAYAYDIRGTPQGHYFVDPVTQELKQSPDAYTRPQAQACFIQSVNDDLVNDGGIFDLVLREARVFKFGSGTGSNFSALRARGEKLAGGGTSSGLMSFLKIFDNAAGAIKSGGTTRRAAKMVILNADHPEIESFVTWKMQEEAKVADLYTGSRIVSKYLDKVMEAAREAKTTNWKNSETLKEAIVEALGEKVPFTLITRGLQLVEQGIEKYDSEIFNMHYEGKAYETVSGQNSNNSVRLPNAFMDANLEGGYWNLTARTTGQTMKRIKASELFDKIAFAAWACADPGLQFDDTIQEWNTCPVDGKINATNPCSEFVFLDNTSCNLASLNLMKFFNEATSTFEVDQYIHATRLWTIVLELSVLMAHFPGKEIAKRTFETRTLGLGYANLGTLLMVLGIPYDSDEGRGIAGAITAMMCGECYATSAEMAKCFGPFPAYERNKEHMLKVIRNHRRAAYNARDAEYEGLTVKPIGINPAHCPEYMLKAAQQCMDKALTLGEQHGYRNAQVNLIAPTGCLTSDSLVSTERGLVPLGTLGDINGQQWQDVSFKIQTHEGEKLATKFFINGVAQTRRIRTASGFEIQGTPQHRIKVVDPQTGEWTWKHFADVKSGDIVPLAMNSMIGEPREVRLPAIGENYWNQEHKLKVPKTTSPELAELVGYFMGDGSLHSKGLRFCVTKEDQDVAQRIADLSKQLFNLEAHVEEKQGYLEVALHSVNLTLWWEASGFDKLLPNEGHSGKGYIPRIPTAILYTNDKKCYSAFIKGLFEADGTVTNGAPTWTSAKKEFAMQVKSLLLALGFPTSINLCKSQWGQSTLYVLRVLNQSYNGEFKKQIGFIGARKNNAITISSEGHSSRRDYIHLPEAVMQKAIQTGIAKNALTMSLKRRNALTRRSVKQIYEVTSDSEIGQALNFYYDIVDANEDGGEQLTYDLSVPENVTYIANGFVSHNTIALQMDCDTTGVEPDFAIVKFKKLAGGGYLKIVNQSVEKALAKLGYTAAQIIEIENYCTGKGTLQNAPHVNFETLKAKGFTDEKLSAVEKQLGSAFDIAFVFNKFTLGEEFCAKLGFTKQQLDAPDFNMLEAFGFTSEQVQKANDYVCGTMTIEGAPHLKEEHYPIFDCANKCGRYGKRFIHYDGHLKMMAATQPFMSGAISKTINMPNDATLQDVKDAYLKSWKYMLKAIALYRDGSKLSQPLNTVSQAEDELTKLIGSDENDVDEQVGAKQLHEAILIRGQKMKMPTKRAGFVQEARIGGQKLFLRTGEYENGQLGEIFVDMYKEGASYRSILNCFAIAVSKGLQYGVPLEEFIETFSFSRFEPSGVVNGDESITNATSILDYVFKALEREYVLKQKPMAAPIVKAQRTLNPSDLPQEPTKPTVTFNAHPTVSTQIKPVEKGTVGKMDAKALGYTGEQCGRCGSMKVKRNGACSVCIDCGETTGCS